MTIEIGFGGASKSTPSITYFDITIPTDGSTKKVNHYKASNSGNSLTIPHDFAVTYVQLAAVPNGIKVHVHFESENVTLNENKTKVDLPGSGLALGNSTVSATI